MKGASTILCCGILLVLAGCRHTRPLAERQDYTLLNDQASGRNTIVALRNGQRVTASSLRIAPDSTSWIDAHTGAFINVATGEIETVRMSFAGRGALEGLGFGLFGGGTAGAAIGLAFGEDNSLFDKEDYALGWGIAGGFISGLVGLFIGTGLKSWDVYLVPRSNAQAGERVAAGTP